MKIQLGKVFCHFSNSYKTLEFTDDEEILKEQQLHGYGKAKLNFHNISPIIWLTEQTGVKYNDLNKVRNLTYKKLDFFNNDPIKIQIISRKEYNLLYSCLCLHFHLNNGREDQSSNESAGFDFMKLILISNIIHVCIALFYEYFKEHY